MEQRRQEIVDLVNQQGEVSFTTLRERFSDVSEVTLRKDLRFLDAEHRLIRIYGGAKSIRSTYVNTTNYYMRYALHADEKKMIAQKAVKMLKPYDSIFLAAGSTCSAIAQEIKNIPLHVFTDGVETAVSLSKLKNIEITVLGGELDAERMQIIGPKVLLEIGELRLDYAFTGAMCYNVGYGFGVHSVHAMTLMQMLRRRADKLVVVLDSSKVEVTKAVRNMPEQEVDMLISDGKLPKDVMAYLKKNHVKVV